MNTTVRKSTDKGLSRIKKAMDSNQNPLSPWEVDFVRTSCRILDIDSEEMVNRIGKRALEKGNGQVRRVMTAKRAQLDDLGKRVEAHRRATPTPAFSTRAYNDMDALARSLAHLQVCAKGLRDAMVGGFSKGIKVAKIMLENALGDFKVTVARTGEAARWKQGVADEWYNKRKEVCGTLLEESVGALQEAEAREGAEAKVRLMESQCEELESLANQLEKQAATETETQLLNELEEELEYEKGNVASLAQTVKETIPAEFKERAQQAIQDSAKIAEEGKCQLGDLRARLKFRSADSEAGSYKGPVGPVVEAGPGNHLPAEAPERGKRTGEGSPPAADDLAILLRGWGQLRANDNGWLTFDDWYASYPPVQEGVGGLQGDVPLHCEQRPSCNDPEREVRKGGCPQDGEPPRRPGGDVGDPGYLL
jgi:hypothetical protein